MTVLGLLLAHVTYAQQTTVGATSTFSIQPGISLLTLKDRTFSPVAFSGTVPGIRFGFERQPKDGARWGIDLALAYGTINYADNDFFTSTYIAAQLNAFYLRKMKAIGSANVYLGGRLGSVVNILDYDGYESGGWYSAQQVEPVVRYVRTLNEKQVITAQFSYPLVSLVSRPTYAGVDEFIVVNGDDIPRILYSRLEVYTVDKLIHPQLEFTYSYTLPKLRLLLTGAYDYLQVNSAREYRRSQWGLGAGIQFNLNTTDEN